MNFEDPYNQKGGFAMADEVVLAKAEGLNGRIEVLPDRVRIYRKGLESLVFIGPRGTKEILIRKITSIQFKKVTAFTGGYIQFSFAGGQEVKGGILMSAIISDENAVTFRSHEQAGFENVKRVVEERMAELNEEKPSTDTASELEKLANLYAQGVLSDEEFAQAKRRVLSPGNSS